MDSSKGAPSWQSPFPAEQMKQNTVNVRRLEGYGLWNEQTLKELVTEALAECDWWGYVWLHENSWRLDSFFNIENLMSDREYWSLLGHVWLHCNAPHERFRDWLRLWQSSRPHQEFVMDQQERTAFAAFPDQLTIYRGVHVERGILQGFSWTLDRQRAEWFANCRAKHRPFLVQAEVCRSNVRAHFLARVRPRSSCYPIGSSPTLSKRSRSTKLSKSKRCIGSPQSASSLARPDAKKSQRDELKVQ